MVKVSKWTDEELKFLVKHWHKIPNKEIGLMIGKSGGAVRLKAEKYITFDMMYGKKWSELEDNLLLKLYGTMSIAELSIRMKRSEKSIFQRIMRIEGSQDVTIVQDVYSCHDVSLFLGLHKNTILNMYKRGDIPMIKVSGRNIVINSNQFWEWLENNLDKPNYLNIKDSTQLISPQWYQKLIREKKQEDNYKKSYIKWSSKEDAILWSELMKGATHKEIALKLNRSTPSVSNRVIILSKKKMLKLA